MRNSPLVDSKVRVSTRWREIEALKLLRIDDTRYEGKMIVQLRGDPYRDKSVSLTSTGFSPSEMVLNERTIIESSLDFTINSAERTCAR